MSQQQIHNSVTLFGGQRQNTVIILFKKFLPASAIAIMSWQDVTRFSFAQVSRSVEQNMHKNFSFPNHLSESEELVLGMFKDFAIILDVI
jgi:hypothetical protein